MAKYYVSFHSTFTVHFHKKTNQTTLDCLAIITSKNIPQMWHSFKAALLLVIDPLETKCNGAVNKKRHNTYFVLPTCTKTDRRGIETWHLECHRQRLRFHSELQRGMSAPPYLPRVGWGRPYSWEIHEGQPLYIYTVHAKRVTIFCRTEAAVRQNFIDLFGAQYLYSTVTNGTISGLWLIGSPPI